MGVCVAAAAACAVARGEEGQVGGGAGAGAGAVNGGGCSDLFALPTLSMSDWDQASWFPFIGLVGPKE